MNSNATIPISLWHFMSYLCRSKELPDKMCHIMKIYLIHIGETFFANIVTLKNLHMFFYRTFFKTFLNKWNIDGNVIITNSFIIKVIGTLDTWSLISGNNMAKCFALCYQNSTNIDDVSPWRQVTRTSKTSFSDNPPPLCKINNSNAINDPQ